MKTINKKWCWLATETKKGWRLKLCYGLRDFNVVGFIVKDITEIITMTGRKGKIVFVHLKEK